MTDRVIPRAETPRPQGAFEHLMAFGQHLPGAPGHICYRKLKRRFCKRAQDTFAQVLADTGAGDLCIDLGANMGTITRRMADTGAEVIAFEPDPETFRLLQDAVAALPNVTLHQKAAGAAAAQLRLRRSANWSPDDPGRNNESASIVRNDGEVTDAHSVMVDVVDLPAFLAGLDRDIRILKMDIEGAEWDLMQALVDHPVLARIDCIFVETHERMDPARYIPVFHRLQAFAEATRRPYINLYWV